jgi:hypothetical protein
MALRSKVQGLKLVGHAVIRMLAAAGVLWGSLSLISGW